MIRFIVSPNFSPAQQSMQDKVFQQIRLPTSRIRYSRTLNSVTAEDKLIAVSDPKALSIITDNKRESLNLCRGSVYSYDRRPAIVFDKILNNKFGPVYSSFLWHKDAEKLKRYANGTRRYQPWFVFQVVRTLVELQALEDAAREGLFAALDVETRGTGDNAHITCVGYSIWHSNNSLSCFVVPFFRGDTKAPGRFFRNERMEATVRDRLRVINDLPILKVLHNGFYDAHYFIREGMPLRSWFLDTSIISHSLRAESPKRIYINASIYCDSYQYWKDEGKVEAKAKEDTKAGNLPTTPEGMQNFWEYNAKDVYYTACILPQQLQELLSSPRALENYSKSIFQTIGPALAMSLRGVRIDETRRTNLIQQKIKESAEAISHIRALVGNPDFNPFSPKQFAHILYDVLKTKEVPRKGKTVRETVLKTIRTQGVLERLIIDGVIKAKKPQNIISKYGPNLKLWNERLYYSLQPTGTKFLRYSSSDSAFRVGTQIQNLHKGGGVREFIAADPGYILAEVDYSASDAYFTAYTTDEENFIRNLTGPQDLHCLHAATFFNRSYEEVFQGYKNEEDWVVGSTIGLRQIAKKVCYAANYGAEGETLYIEMGVEMAASAADQLGYTKKDYKGLVSVCNELVRIYNQEIYPGLKPWLKREIIKVKRNNNWATCIGGIHAHFMGSLNDKKYQRELASFYGQGGTSANILQATQNVWLSDWESRGGMLLFQLHDALIFQVPQQSPELITELCNHMLISRVSPAGKEFIVPVEGKWGTHWGKGMKEWNK